MSETSPPTYENAIKKFVDRPNLLTLLSGGAFFGVLIYFMTGYFLSTFEIDFQLLQFLMVGLVILISFRMGLSADVEIQVNTKTGWIEARGSGIKYEGYAVEPEKFLVLQKQSMGRSNQPITDYKISLVIDEETEFNIPLEINEVRDAIKTIEKAKEAVPIENS